MYILATHDETKLTVGYSCGGGMCVVSKQLHRLGRKFDSLYSLVGMVMYCHCQLGGLLVRGE